MKKKYIYLIILLCLIAVCFPTVSECKLTKLPYRTENETHGLVCVKWYHRYPACSFLLIQNKSDHMLFCYIVSIHDHRYYPPLNLDNIIKDLEPLNWNVVQELFPEFIAIEVLKTIKN